MNPTCQDLAPLLSARASGALEPAEAERLDAHLAACPGCRLELESLEDVLGLARQAPPSEAEEASLRDLEDRLRSSWERSERRRTARWRVAAVVGAVAAAATLVLAPGLVRHPAPVAVATSQDGWQAPDPDEIWSEANGLSSDGALDGESAYESALALDDADGP